MPMLSAKEIAAQFGTTPKKLRKFLRKDESLDSPGKGGRYAIDSRKANSLQKRFNAWNEANAAKENMKDDSPEGE